MNIPVVRRLALILILLIVASLAPVRAGAQDAAAEREYWPTDGWRSAPPEERGMDPVLLAQIAPWVQTQLPLLSGLVVVRGGDIAYEQYDNGQTADQPIHIWSVTKSVTSMQLVEK